MIIKHRGYLFFLYIKFHEDGTYNKAIIVKNQITRRSKLHGLTLQSIYELSKDWDNFI